MTESHFLSGKSQLKTSAPLILLYNPISGHGHLDSWNALFVGFLLEAGWQVASLGQAADDLRTRLAGQLLANHPNLRILEWRAPKRSFYQRVRSKLFRMSRQLISDVITNEVDAAKLKNLEASYLQPHEFAQRVADATLQLGRKPSFVFNMYMDLYRDDQLGWRPFDEIHRIPWAGIRFVPSPTPPSEAYYRLQSLKGMCFLDEHVRQNYVKHLPQKVFEYLPDVTDTNLPVTESSFAIDIARRAADRKIVFMGGTIGDKKNLSQWYKLIGLANPAEWFFVQIGEVREQVLGSDDLSAYRRALLECPENLFLHAQYLPDERIFNEVIALSDIVFAAYHKFSISSNMPGKAAAFEKPILVSQGYLMGARVNQYQIGLTAPEDDAAQMLQALKILAQPPAARSVALPEHFAAYRQDFSHDALKDKLFNFLDRAIALAKA